MVTRPGIVCVCCVALALDACGGRSAPPGPTVSTPPTTAVATTATTTPATTTATGTTATHPRVHRPPRPSLVAIGLAAGRLPQTDARPRSDTPGFRVQMRALWTAIATGSPHSGLGAFFPETAYAQIKALADPAGDFAGRLVADFKLDIGAAHALVAGAGGRAQLVDVRVPSAYVHWVSPGVCVNRFGYWEVPNARVVYRAGGQTRSFGIASMISWRGAWYVVHLGAVLRSGGGGVVDDPSQGPGVSAPSSTC